jgi:hypothetical protein
LSLGKKMLKEPYSNHYVGSMKESQYDLAPNLSGFAEGAL